MNLTTLRQQWLALTVESRVTTDAALTVWREILTAYRAPQRHYHTLSHLGKMLAFVARHRSQAQNFTALRYAIWFHDVVYDPHRSDNEELSALHAERSLRELKVKAPVIAKTRRLILATQHHQANHRNRDAQLLLDADLAILSASRSEYAAYARAIRREFSWVEDAAYRAGRTQVLQKFLARKQIYFTEAMQANEAIARLNLTREIARLQ